MTTEQSTSVPAGPAGANGAAPDPGPGQVPDPGAGAAGPVMSERVMAAIGFVFAIGLAVIAVDLWMGGRLLGGAQNDQD